MIRVVLLCSINVKSQLVSSMSAQNALTSIHIMEKQTKMGCRIIENDTCNYILSIKLIKVFSLYITFQDVINTKRFTRCSQSGTLATLPQIYLLKL